MNDYIKYDPLDLNEYVKAAPNSAGAQVVFTGLIRNSNEGKEITSLEYEVHESLAKKMVGEILEDARVKFQLEFANCVHRVGKVEIGDMVVIVITQSGHREEAYEANRYILDRVKFEVPIWKKEWFPDGSYVWGRNSGKNSTVPE